VRNKIGTTGRDTFYVLARHGDKKGTKGTRYADEKRREQCIAQEWEFPVVEIVFEVSPLRS